MQCINQKELWVDGHGFLKVPCGKCVSCLVNRRSDWSFRLEQEHKYSSSAYFVTLTYDQKHAPSDGGLVKRHLQLFMKRLRKMDGTNKIRYYAVGEYGSKSGRPHYHLLLFNLVNPDHCRAAWRDDQKKAVGIVHIGNVTPASVAYVTKYMVQPSFVSSELPRPFSVMSRAYGIGGRYLTDEMVSWHRADDRNYTMRHNQKLRLPRFYREKIWTGRLPLKKNQKVTRATAGIQANLLAQRSVVRQRVSKKAMELTLANQEKERTYYQSEHGDNWEAVYLDSRNANLARVKVKVAFTQTF